jgi:hypothetical protein
LLYAAWFKDCGTDTYLDLARALRFPLDGLPGAEQSAKRKAIRDVERGRALASSLGIWPWASWPDGKPPEAEWWTNDRSREWLREWIAQAQGQAALLRSEAVEASLVKPQLLIRSALARRLLVPAEISERFQKILLTSVGAGE